MPYPYESILLNQRTVRLDDCVAGTAVAQSAFEKATLQFIRDWLSGTKEFSIHTSGSTGTPKSITLTREAIKQSALRTISAIGLREHDTALICLNTEYIAGKMMVVRALEGNMNIIAVDPTSDPFEKLSTEQHIDFIAVVPLQLESILSTESGRNRLNGMKAVIAGGAAVSDSLRKKIEAIQTPVYATYGMTETISHVALHLLNTTNRSEYFKTLAGVQINLDDRGCLVIEDEILTETVVTNDLVELHSPTEFKWLGRADHIINTGGVKVSPEKTEQQIEHIINRMTLNRKFFVAGIPHETLGQQVVLLMEGEPLAMQTEHELQSRLKDDLSPFEQPKRVLYVNHFQYTSTGKINRVKTVESLKD
jgi:O-succinylbenzoic acid--CoA ligase